MNYDRLAEAAERHFPQWAKIVQDARVFVIDREDEVFEKNHSELAKRTLRTWDADEAVIENFRLPFPTVAIECCGCTILHEVEPGKRIYRALMVGNMSAEMIVAECGLAAFPDENFLDHSKFGKAAAISNLRVWSWRRSRVEEVQFSMNEVTGRSKSKAPMVAMVGEGLQVGSDIYYGSEARQVAVDLLPELEADVDVSRAKVAYMQLCASVWFSLRICEPSSFVVEHTHVDFVPKEPKKGKVIRSPYRPHYIVLTPGEIRKRFIRDDDGESIPSGMTRRPHERRGHFRKLTSEKFVSKRNHVIWIKPCWVGKTEGVIGKNRYVVRLDI